MPLYPEEPDITRYKKGVHNFNKNMKVEAKLKRGEKVATTSHKESFNQTVCKRFELWFRQNELKVTDKQIVDWICEEFSFHVKDIDSLIVRRKFWMIKNQFKVKSAMNLSDVVMRDLERDCSRF